MQGQVNKMDNNERKPSHTNAETNATVLPPRPHSVIAKAAARTGIESSLNNSEQKFGEDSESMAADNVHETVRLPQVFGVKYLGKREARGLWGIKYTRGPVDDMVNTAKALKPGTALPFLQFKVGIEGVTVSEMQANTNKDFESGFYPVDIISYGVQDLVYTRVFSMIVVRDPNITSASLVSGRANPFECYAYVCDSRLNARRLTIALATAFQEFSKTVKSQKMKQKRIAIDLRTPEEMAAELEDQETEA